MTTPTVRDRMTSQVITVTLDTPASEIARVIETRRISALPVLDGAGALAGIISTTDLVRKLTADAATPSARASDLMTSPVVVAKPAEPLDDAAWRMVAARAHRLVVVEEERVVGILSVRDLLGAFVGRPLREPIRTIMSSPVETIAIDAPIEDAVRRLADAGVHGLVVVDDDRAVGVFTQLEAIAARTLPHLLRAEPVEKVMSYETICFDVHAPIERVAREAAKQGARRILVFEDKKLVGISSDLDLVDVLARAGAGPSP